MYRKVICKLLYETFANLKQIDPFGVNDGNMMCYLVSITLDFQALQRVSFLTPY